MTDKTEEPERTPLMDALTYPVRGSGWAMVVIGAVIALLPGLFSGIMYLGPIAWVMGLCYFNAFYFLIVESTVSGKDDTPDWPDVSNITEDLLLPFLRTLRVAVLSFFPLLIVLYIRDEPRGMWGSPAVWAGISWGVFYFPMAMLNTIVSNDMAASLPHRVLPLIKRGMPSYLVLTGLLVVALLFSRAVTGIMSGVPLIGGLLSAATGLYFMMAEARLAGTFYRRQLEFDAEDEEDAPRLKGIQAEQARE